MSKAVMLSTHPKWCELIANGKKTIEIRKTCPTLKTPFKVYIYQTKRKWKYKFLEELGLCQGKVIGDFVCNKITKIGMFTLDDPIEFEKQSCLKGNEIMRYLKGFDGYGWHISNLKIYDKPKELGEFWKADKCLYSSYVGCKYKYHCYRAGENNHKNGRCGEKLTNPPKPWCYVEEL